MTKEKTDELKEAMINLIKKSYKVKENFVFERLQEFMDLSDLSNPKWTKNVRLRMLDNEEAREQGKKEERERIIKKIDEIVEGAVMYADMIEDEFWKTSKISPKEAEQRAKFYQQFQEELKQDIENE